MNCLRDGKLMSSTFSAEELMKTDKLVDKYESSHQFQQPAVKYPVTTDYTVFQKLEKSSWPSHHSAACTLKTFSIITDVIY